jgi:hypothetical protein
MMAVLMKYLLDLPESTAKTDPSLFTSVLEDLQLLYPARQWCKTRAPLQGPWRCVAFM